MAQAIAFHSGSPLIGSPSMVTPLTFAVTPSPHLSTYTFHRVVLRVYAGLIVPDGNDPNAPSDETYSEMEFSRPINSNSTVLFDISTALQAVTARYNSPETPVTQNPNVKFRLMAYDEWVEDGEVHSNAAPQYYPGGVIPVIESHPRPELLQYAYCYAFMGAFTDRERLLNSVNGELSNAWWTRKPLASPEVVFVGRKVVLPWYFNAGIDFVKYVGETWKYVEHEITDEDFEGFPPVPDGGPKSNEITITTPGLQTLYDGWGINYKVFAIQEPANAYEIRFVNGFGCLESIHLICLPSIEVPIQTEKYVVSRQETLDSFSRGLAVKQNDRERWKMSSGTLDLKWLQWYIHEFMLAEMAWINTGTNANPIWLPIHVLPGETTKTIDRTTNKLLSVEFTIEFDLLGSPI